MDESQFISSVAKTEFAPQYYALCKQFPTYFGTCKSSTKEIRRILNELDRSPECWFSSPRAYQHETRSQCFVLSIGFRFHGGNGGTEVDFDFCAEANDGSRIGGPFAAIALDAATETEIPTPKPPYPRPHFRSLDGLSELLSKAFSLGDILITCFDTPPT